MTLEMEEAEKEQVLFRYNVTKDWLRKKVVHSYLVTNKHGSYQGKGRVIGDVIFNSPAHPDLIFKNVPRPDGIVRLFKSLKRGTRR